MYTTLNKNDYIFVKNYKVMISNTFQHNFGGSMLRDNLKINSDVGTTVIVLSNLIPRMTMKVTLKL